MFCTLAWGECCVVFLELEEIESAVVVRLISKQVLGKQPTLFERLLSLQDMHNRSGGRALRDWRMPGVYVGPIEAPTFELIVPAIYFLAMEKRQFPCGNSWGLYLKKNVAPCQ